MLSSLKMTGRLKEDEEAAEEMSDRLLLHRGTGGGIISVIPNKEPGKVRVFSQRIAANTHRTSDTRNTKMNLTLFNTKHFYLLQLYQATRRNLERNSDKFRFVQRKI